jgi:hypothetical protein
MGFTARSVNVSNVTVSVEPILMGGFGVESLRVFPVTRSLVTRP